MANLAQPSEGRNFYDMKDKIAKVISNDKVVHTRKQVEVQRICAESDELKALKAKIEAAYLNKERAGQMAESQFRAQRQIQDETQFERQQLLLKEEQDRLNKMKMAQAKVAALQNKEVVTL